jgi:NAD(P)-dependent dehydrogenase (short-subunit alcohol dehydrogenase family)
VQFVSIAQNQNPRVWFITGISRGLGRELALSALAEGDSVIGTTRNGKSDLSSGQFSVLALDVSRAEDVAAAVAKAWAIHGRIDILVNNAGFGLLGAVEEVDEATARKVFDTNFFGTFHVIHAVLPLLRAQSSGHILNVSSIGGFTGTPGYGLYNASKFAVEGLSEALAQELKPFGLHVTIIEPGSFRTGFLSGNSLQRAGRVIEAYASTSGKARASADVRDGRQAGNPVLAARAIISITRAAKPPLRLALGPDTLERVHIKLAQVANDLETWRLTTLGTAFPGPPDQSGS